MIDEKTRVVIQEARDNTAFGNDSEMAFEKGFNLALELALTWSTELLREKFEGYDKDFFTKGDL